MLTVFINCFLVSVNLLLTTGYVQQQTTTVGFIPDKIIMVDDLDVNSGSGEDNDTVSPVKTCMQYSPMMFGCHSFQDALQILENNTVINITTDVVLLESIVYLKELNNITIMGQSNTTVECNNSGVLSCSSCNGVSIRGITWNKCGTYMEVAKSDIDLLSISQYPGITLSKCSNIFIHHCTFQNSISSAVHLSEVSGIISIEHVQFLFNGPNILTQSVINNLEYVASGLMIVQPVSIQETTQLNISITRCTFSHNSLAMNGPKHSSVLLVYSNSVHSDVSILISEASFISNDNLFCSKTNVPDASLSILKIKIMKYLNVASVMFSEVTFESNRAQCFRSSSILEFIIVAKRFARINIQIMSSYFINNTAVKVFHYQRQTNLNTFSSVAGDHDQGSGYKVMQHIYSNKASSNDADIETMNVINGCLFSYNVADKSVLYISSNYDSDNYSDQFTIMNSTFEHNSETVIYVINQHVTFQKTVKFVNNIADYGAAIYLDSGASIKFDEGSNLMFTSNFARRYGGVIFYDLSQFSSTCENEHMPILVKDNSTVNFNNNVAGIAGQSIYVSIPQSCNISSLLDLVNDFNYSEPTRDLITSPNELILHSPAVLISNADSVTVYKLSGIMLGQTINIPACVLDYLRRPIERVLFKVSRIDVNQNYSMMAPNLMSISCESLRTGNIHIIGEHLRAGDNSSVIIQFSSSYNSGFNWKSIRANLIIELSPCHPGYFYDKKLKQCVCYETKNVVSCLSGHATIMKGYWFGMIDDQPTMTNCPINYCDFKHCETATRVCTLPSSLDEQCMPHRTGPACGNCVEGYTLSFDSLECVNTDKCSIGATILVIIITLMYWAVITAAVFGIMYFQINIAYFYAITYFYGMLDILFEQTLDPINHGFLYTLVAVMSGMIKMTPRFLGQLCFVEGMSGIDQQFIHYMHPLAIWLVIAVTCVLARFSRRLSSFLSRGIIQTICLLILLSFSAGASSTSLMLMRGFYFTHTDKLYVYVSPDIVYFQGQHLFYSMVAYIFVILIAIGLPLILFSEPFLNRKINFSRFKPLLDQFQGCYKDRLRWFASYYMICRQGILNIVVYGYDRFIPLNLLLVTCTIINLIHWLVRPYASKVLNIYDGLVLQIMTAIIALQIIYFENFDSVIPIGTAVILVMLPVMMFLLMALILNKEYIKKLYISCLFALKLTKQKQNDHECANTEYDVTVNQELQQRSTTVV